MAHSHEVFERNYVEKEKLTLPVIDDGPIALGDIWDCQTSTCVGFNIFGKVLAADHIRVDSKKSYEYELSHIRSSKDKHKSLNVQGEISLELYSGLIKVSGAAEYDSNDVSASHVEEVMCSYEVRTYSVGVLPAAKDVLDDLVVQKILKGEIKGTHIVSGITLGGSMNASLRVKESSTSAKENISGSFFGKMTFGPVSASVKVALGILDTSKASDFEKHIQVSSRPPIKSQPSTIENMFAVVESISDLVEKENYFSHLNLPNKIYGVPIRFTLVPITQFLDVSVENLYMQIKDETLERLTDLFVLLKDVQVYRFLSKRILERCPNMQMILVDPRNPLSQEVTTKENEMGKVAKKLFVDAAEALKSYKMGKTDQADLLKLVTRVGLEINIGNILQDVDDFIQKGRQELIGINQGNIRDGHRIKSFTNEIDLEEWYQETKPIKILFKTSGPTVSSTIVSTLYDITDNLYSLGVEVGVAVPNVSNYQYTLTIKSEGSEEIYKADRIPFVIRILQIIVGKAHPIHMRCFSIFASIQGINIPFIDHLSDLNKLIKLFWEIPKISIAESYLQLRDCIQRDSSRYKFVLSIGAVESAAESIRACLYLSSIMTDIPGEWIAGEFGFESCNEYTNAPLILVFKNEKLIASCFDTLDILLLHQCIRTVENSQQLENTEMNLIEVSKFTLERNCLYRARGNFALQVLRLFDTKTPLIETSNTLEDLSGFPYEANAQARFTSLVIAGLCRMDIHAMVTGQGNITIAAFPDLKQHFEKCGWIINKNCKILNAPNRIDFTLIGCLEHFLQSQNPFSFKLFQAIGVLHECKENADEHKELILKYTVEVREDAACPDTLKAKLSTYQQMPSFQKAITQIISELESHTQVGGTSEYPSCFRFIQLLKLAKNDHDGGEMIKFVKCSLIPSLIAELHIDDSKYPGVTASIQRYQQSQDFYGVLGLLAAMNVHPDIFRLMTILNDFTTLDDISGLNHLVNRALSKPVDDERNRVLFSNEKVQYLLKNASETQDFLEKLKCYHCNNNIIPNYLPSFLKLKLKALVDNDKKEELPEELENVDQVIRVFRQIANCDVLPGNFSKILMRSLIKNKDLLQAFQEANALYHWDDSEKIFTEAWDCDTVRSVLEILTEWIDNQTTNVCTNTTNNNSIDFDMSYSTYRKKARHHRGEDFEKLDFVNDDVKGTHVPDTETPILHQLMGPNIVKVSQKEFIKVEAIVKNPLRIKILNDGYISKLMPYMIQRLKMWGIHVIDPTNLSHFVELTTGAALSATPYSQKDETRRLRFGKKIAESSFVTQVQKTNVSSKSHLTNTGNPISRMDFISCLFAICDPMVFQDLIKVVSQFPVALPFVIRNIASSNKPTYNCLLPFLKTIQTKWESGPGIVQHNKLFTDPYKLIVAMRMGTPEPGKPGKSTILNQLLSSRSTFSSFSDPGSGLGKALSVDGSVELCVLNEESCSLSLWQSVIKEHYMKGTNQVLLLANLHGNAIEHPDAVSLLKTIAYSFIVYFMPMPVEQLERNCVALEAELRIEPEQTFHVLVDPTPECEDLLPGSVIRTSQLTSDSTLVVARRVFEEAVHSDLSPARDEDCTTSHRSNVTIFPELVTTESHELIQFVKYHGVKKVKSSLQLQTVNSISDEYSSSFFKIWEQNQILKEFIFSFVDLLHLPISSRLVALGHLDREISALSEKESAVVRSRIAQLQKQKRTSIVPEESVHLKSQISMLDIQINEGFQQLDEMTLGLENIYRELARVFEMAQASNTGAYLLESASNAGETLINGQSIEVLDGEQMQVYGAWFNACCHTACKQFGNDFKVFVLSIIGLQSSGKSTLLNALFACKFAVSVGRCTRGLFMRLLFLEDKLVQELGVDAILILDSEGLGAPEKLNDGKAEQKDRLLATFAMSLSHLTLINVLGESLRDLTDILQIVVVTLARLERAEISPDILMVQHLSERNSSKTMKGFNEFCEALKEAVALTEKQDMTIGVRNCQSLKRLEQRLENNGLLHQFPPFKNGATVNAPPSQNYHDSIIELYNVILDSCKNTHNVETFHKWHERVQSYWDAVSTQDFALRFKNIKEVQDFISRGALIAEVKNDIDGAFRTHRDEFEVQIRDKVQKLTSPELKNAGTWSEEKEQLLLSIEEKLTLIPKNCLCQYCVDAIASRDKLFKNVEKKSYEASTRTTINKYAQSSRDDMLKHFDQMIEALVITNGKIFEIDAIILEELKSKLEIKNKAAVKNAFSELEVHETVNKIWSQVIQIVSTKLTIPSASRRIQQEIDTLYEADERVTIEITSPKEIDFGNLEALDNTTTKFYKSKKLTREQISVLKASLHLLPEFILKEYSASKFETGMCNHLKKMISQKIAEFEENSIEIGKLTPTFKQKVHVYAIKLFRQVMEKKDEEWNKVNNPMHILRANEDTYKQVMAIRLRDGFGLGAEGKIVGGALLASIRLRGQKSGDRAHLDFIKENTWLTGSENVRLKYFSDLADQVSNNKKQNTLQQFSSPKSTINQWFAKELDQISKKTGHDKFITTLKEEHEKVKQDIENTSSYEHILKYVQKYLTGVAGVVYNPKPELKVNSNGEFLVFRSAILDKLEAGYDTTLMLDIEITNPSNQKEVQKLLGCTESCPFCGALCWGEFGHAENDGNTKKHHACHQPRGLVGATADSVHGANYLQPLICDTMDENFWTVSVDGNIILWKDAKLHNKFSHWLYMSHNRDEFNELMKWFFVQLQQELASKYNCAVTPAALLRENGFTAIQCLEIILSAMRLKIGFLR